MRYAFLFIILTIVLACNHSDKQQKEKLANPALNIEDCFSGDDTSNFITSFRKHKSEIPTKQFSSIVRFVNSQGFFKPSMRTTGSLNFDLKDSRVLKIVYDTCNMRRWITKNFILKNLQITALNFIGIEKDRRSDYIPRMHFEEWKFVNNIDRDSAMKIIQIVYFYPENTVMYDKSFPQFILDDKTIFLLETNAKFAEQYVIKYKKIIEQFIRNNYKIY